MVDSQKSTSERIRFEVFMRDYFTCQKCGLKSPDALLEIVCVRPISSDEKIDSSNLTTSCKGCVLEGHLVQTDSFQERKNQVQMMFASHLETVAINSVVTDNLSERWLDITNQRFPLDEKDLLLLKKMQRDFNPAEILASMDIASEQYFSFENGELNEISVKHAWSKVSGICKNRNFEKNTPGISRLPYIIGILRNRFNYCDSEAAMRIMKLALSQGKDIEWIEQHSKESANWSSWRSGFDSDHFNDEDDELY